MVYGGVWEGKRSDEELLGPVYPREECGRGVSRWTSVYVLQGTGLVATPHALENSGQCAWRGVRRVEG